MLSDEASVKKCLDNYPSIKHLSRTKTLSYVARETERDHFYIASFEKDRITLTVYSKTSPTYLSGELLLRLLSFCAMLHNEYEFDIKEIFPYLIESLAGNHINTYKDSIESRARGSNQGNSDIILAKRINSLVKENMALKELNKSLESKKTRFIAEFIALKYGNNAIIDSIERENQLESWEVAKALEFMQSTGYRLVYISKERFRLIKA